MKEIKRRSHISLYWFSCGTPILIEFEFEDADFYGRRKTVARREATADSAQMQHQAEVEPGPHSRERRPALTPLLHSCSNFIILQGLFKRFAVIEEI